LAEELYRMILVDDEDEERGRISSKVSAKSGFSVVATAGNGYDALELIERHKPHIVVTDIKMPYIDGIELASIIRRDFPTVRVAFITGFDEFDYAREAVELHASSFLTKPVTQEDISGFLDKLKAELDGEFNEKYNVETLRRRYEESVPLIIDNYLTSFLISFQSGNAEDMENLAKHGVRLDDARYLLAYVKIERDDSLRDIIDYEKMKLSVRSVLSSIAARNDLGHHSFMFHEGIVIILKESGANFPKKADNVFYEMIKMTETFLSTGIDIGVSKSHGGFGELHAAYAEAEKALGYSGFLNAGRIVYIDQLEEKKPRIVSLADSDSRSIDYQARYGTDDELRSAIQDVKARTPKDRDSFTSYRPYIISLLNVVVCFAASINIDLHDVIADDELDRLMHSRNIDLVFDKALETLLRLREANVSSKLSNSERILDSFVKYMEENFSDPSMSLDRVCDELAVSPSYISLLLRRHKGTTFVTYLTKLRMERGKELLRFTADRITEVAEKCGYRDVYYFSHTFKRYTGEPPKKYREEIHT